MGADTIPLKQLNQDPAKGSNKFKVCVCVLSVYTAACELVNLCVYIVILLYVRMSDLIRTIMYHSLTSSPHIDLFTGCYH